MTGEGGERNGTESTRGGAVTGTEWVAIGARPSLCLDAEVVNPARLANFLLGGKDFYQPDRDFGEALLGTMPEAVDLALQGRAFVSRVVRCLAEEYGVDQFVDLGMGLPVPSGDDVADVACSVNPSARVLYVDHDELVLAFGRALLARPNVVVAAGDLRAPREIVYGPELCELIDASRPVAVLMCSVLEHLVGTEDAAGAVTMFREWMAPGSFLVVSHLCSDGVDADRLARVRSLHAAASVPLALRGEAEIAGWFGGLDLLDLGLVDVARWRPFMPQICSAPRLAQIPWDLRGLQGSSTAGARLVGVVGRKPWSASAWVS